MKNILEKIIRPIKNINSKYENFVTNSKLKYIFQFLPKNIFLLIFFVVLLSIFIPKLLTNEVISLNTSIIHETYKLEKEKPVSTNLDIDKDNIKKADYLMMEIIEFTDYKNKYNIKMYENDNIIYEKTFSIKGKETVNKKKFNIKKIKFNSKNKYKLELTPIDVDNVEVLVDSSNKNLKVYFINNSPFKKFVMVVSIIFLILFLFINYLINNEKIKSENKFAILMLTYIVPLMIFIPPFQVPDGVYHFYQSYHLGTYKFDQKIGKYLNERKENIPTNLECLNYGSIQELNNVPNKKNIENCFKDTHKYKQHIAPALLNSGNTLYYLPAALIIRIVLIFTSNPIIVFYMGRIVNFIICFLLLLKAIKVTPKYKNLFIVIGFIPLCIQQMISYSYDGLLNACALLSVAYFIKFYTSKEKIEKKDKLIYLFTAFVLLYLKRVYFVLVPLLFLIPSKKYKKGMKEKLLFIGGTIVLSAIFVYGTTALFSIGKVELPTNPTHVSDIDSARQIQFLMKHPMQLPKVAYHTLKFCLRNYMKEMIGVLGWLNHVLPSSVIQSFYIAFILLVLASKSIFKKLKEKIYVLLLVCMSAGAIFLAMYTGWTTVGAYYAIGIQGRYFIPLLLPTLMCFMPKKEILKIKDNTVYTYLNMMLLVLTVFIMISYY